MSYKQLVASEGQYSAAEDSGGAGYAHLERVGLRAFHPAPDLAAIYISIKEDGKPEKGLFHIKNNLSDYWGSGICSSSYWHF